MTKCFHYLRLDKKYFKKIPPKTNKLTTATKESKSNIDLSVFTFKNVEPKEIKGNNNIVYGISDWYHFLKQYLLLYSIFNISFITFLYLPQLYFLLEVMNFQFFYYKFLVSIRSACKVIIFLLSKKINWRLFFGVSLYVF